MSIRSVHSLKPIIHESARSQLTEQVSAVVKRLLSLMERVAQGYKIHTTRVEFTGAVDPDENTQELVITQWVEASAGKALRFWDQLGAEIATWTRTLPRQQAGIVDDRIAVEVRWERDDAATDPV